MPTITNITEDAICAVPDSYRHASLAMGATKWQTIVHVIIPSARSGIIAAVILGIGRALGETMAVTMLIGNSNFMPENIFSPGNSMASVIANEFTEATENIHLSALIEIGLILFLITTVVNYFGRKVIKKTSVNV